MSIKTVDLSLVISCCALLISVISIILSMLSYSKDRWKLSLEAWIEGHAFNPTVISNPKAIRTMIRGELYVKMANIGRRALTIEGIWLQVCEEEIEELREIELVYTERLKRHGFVARFPSRAGEFPATLSENKPMFSTISLLGLDPLSRKRLCLVYVTGRRAPIKIPCGVRDHRCKTRYFSGS